MSEQNKDGGAAGGSLSEIETLKAQLAEKEKALTDSKAFNDRVLSEKKAEADARKKAEEKALLADGKFKELFEREKSAREALEAEKETSRKRDLSTKKVSAMTKELFNLGLDEKFVDDALKLVNLDSISVDEATATILGVKETAENFHKKYSSLGFFKKGKATINHDAGNLRNNPQKPVDNMTGNEAMNTLVEIHRKK